MACTIPKTSPLNSYSSLFRSLPTVSPIPIRALSTASITPPTPRIPPRRLPANFDTNLFSQSNPTLSTPSSFPLTNTTSHPTRTPQTNKNLPPTPLHPKSPPLRPNRHTKRAHNLHSRPHRLSHPPIRQRQPRRSTGGRYYISDVYHRGSICGGMFEYQEERPGYGDSVEESGDDGGGGDVG